MVYEEILYTSEYHQEELPLHSQLLFVEVPSTLKNIACLLVPRPTGSSKVLNDHSVSNLGLRVHEHWS